MKPSPARIRSSASGATLFMTVTSNGSEDPQAKTMGNKYSKEFRLDGLKRYRGVAWLVSVPLLLLLTILLLMPRASHSPNDFSRVTEPFHTSTHSQHSASGSAEERYAVVIDAGSTGSRVHVFKFLVVDGQLDLQFDKFEQLRPGLSSYADDPPAAAASLKPLLDLALSTVPKALQGATPVMVGATAGLRLLPDGKADIILDEVRKWLRAGYPFQFSDAEDVKILSGVDEGAFAWLTLNYLLGNLGKPEHETIASIDLGGGSVQEAFAMTAEEAKSAPDASYVTGLKGGGKSYSVYVYSYLGYGLMAGRAAVLGEAEEHPCVPTGYSGQYEYGGKQFSMRPHPEGPSHDTCSATVLSALRHTQECGAPQLQCTFNGAWVGSRLPQVFYISSYFWDRATDAGLVAEESAIQHSLTPKHFADLAKQACSTALSELETAFPRVQEAHRPFFCLDLSYAHTLLTKGFKIPESSTITLVKKVQYKEEQIEAAWPLGAAINLLG